MEVKKICRTVEKTNKSAIFSALPLHNSNESVSKGIQFA